MNGDSRKVSKDDDSTFKGCDKMIKILGLKGEKHVKNSST